MFCSGENIGYGFAGDFLHLPSRPSFPQKSHFPAHTPKITGTSEQARKSLIINRKTCSVTRTTIEQPEQKTELSTGWASFKQTVNDAANSGTPESLFNALARPRARTKNWLQSARRKKRGSLSASPSGYFNQTALKASTDLRYLSSSADSSPRALAFLHRVLPSSCMILTSSSKGFVASRVLG